MNDEEIMRMLERAFDILGEDAMNGRGGDIEKVWNCLKRKKKIDQINQQIVIFLSMIRDALKSWDPDKRLNGFPDYSYQYEKFEEIRKISAIHFALIRDGMSGICEEGEM